MTFALTPDAVASLTLLPDPMPIVAPATPHIESDGSSYRHAALSLEATSHLTLGIVHELNNLTGGIAVLSEIYQQDGSSLPVGEGLDLISESTGRLQTLVRHLKLLHGPLRLEPTYVDLGECVRALLEVFAPVLPKNTVVETDFGIEQFAARLDEALFRQALLAITLEIGHTLAAHPAAGHGLRVSLARIGGDGAELILLPTDAAGVDLRVDRSPAHPERLRDAGHTLLELGGTLKRGSHGEYILELPLVD